jgi:hypothetical protein
MQNEDANSVLIANKVLEILRLNMQIDADLAVVKSAVERWSPFLDSRNGGSLPAQVAMLTQRVGSVERSEMERGIGRNALRVAWVQIIPALLGILGGLLGSLWFK